MESNNLLEILKKLKDYDDYLVETSSTNKNGSLDNNVVGKQIKETTNSVLSAGEYSGPVEIGLKKWRESELGPFLDDTDHYFKDKDKKKNLKDNVKKIVGMWEKQKDSGYDIPTHDVDTIKEDLAVWFGKKKKPKGSKQPAGPWVNICSKKDGKHPPCGRPEGGGKSYPKCRAVGVAAKMSDSQKKSACQQKRKAEKQDTQTGKGQKPVMTSYKPKKKKTNESVLISLIRKALD